jgi:hypothetical protein
MNPLLIIGGLGILGFLMMGYKKKTTTSRPWEGPDETDPSEGQPYQGSRLLPGWQLGPEEKQQFPLNRWASTALPEKLA